MVKASASRTADPRFDSHWRRGDFSGSSQTGDLQIDTLVATLDNRTERERGEGEIVAKETERGERGGRGERERERERERKRERERER